MNISIETILEYSLNIPKRTSQKADIPESAMKQLIAVTAKCQDDPATAVNEKAIDDWKKANRDASRPPDNLGPHTLCIAKAMDWIKQDGKPNTEGLREKLRARVSDKAKVEKILNKCAAEKETPEATALHMVQCVIPTE
ncbi:unnamed protein product [Ceutorhynchus assimilis]|uniref:Uncharacterized protein n=1 Tax=Ceutorhynchus assimilis TaxID=467358 RepID=A0A9N9QIH6_9CUCU|nr:unnamed protein product [Ceutorhynchus assimilis]